jgi:peptidoglycan hydrolase-like amidase
MDQWGAKAMADQGHLVYQILEYYYPGATLRILP